MSKDKLSTIFDYVDHVQPELTPYEALVYLYLLRNSYLATGSRDIRVGKRTIATAYGKGSRGKKTNYEHISKLLKSLEEKDFIKVGDTNREGTKYTVQLPSDIPAIAERIAIISHEPEDDDYFTNPEKRKIIFERDKWKCQYCGEKVTEDNVTLDHFIPQCNGGNNTKDNLRTSCMLCNSIKSGKTFEEAAPLILKNIQERRSRNNSNYK